MSTSINKCGRPTRRPTEQELRVRYKTMTQPEMAAEYGVSIRTVARWLLQMGIKKGMLT